MLAAFSCLAVRTVRCIADRQRRISHQNLRKLSNVAIFLSLERGKESKPALDSLMIFVEEQLYILLTRDPVAIENVWWKDVQRNKNNGNG